VRPHAAICDDDAMMVELNRLSIQDIRARRDAGHRPYVAYLHGTPVAYGWVATRQASIGELNLTIMLPRNDREPDAARRAAYHSRPEHHGCGTTVIESAGLPDLSRRC
jgi:hypothetical protein